MKKPDKQLDEMRSGWQRCQADFENYKKRVEGEKAIWTTQARISVFEEILPILENLDLAVLHAPHESKDQPWIEGIVHITRQIDAKLTELGIEKIAPQPGDELDLNYHEAVLSEKNLKIKPGFVVRTQRTGYKVGETLITPAKVVVGK